MGTAKTGVRLRNYDRMRDLEHCLRLWRRASEVGHPFLSATELDGDEALVRAVYMPAAEIIVAEGRDGPLGFIALLGSTVGGLFVDPLAHGRGVGRRLVEAAAARKGTLEVEVYRDNAGGRAFYARLGFVETGGRATDDQGRPHPLIVMRWE